MLLPEHLKHRTVVTAPEDLQGAFAEFLDRHLESEAVHLAFGPGRHKAIQLLKTACGLARTGILASAGEAFE
jgi:hypothetical protein